MRLLFISNTDHYQDGHVIQGWGPIVREIDYLSVLFDEIVHVAFLHTTSANAACIPYASDNVRLVGVCPSGGRRVKDKLNVLRLVPKYVKAVLEELRDVDVVHVRCPASIPLFALLILAVLRYPSKRWIKYAGNWLPYDGEPYTFRFQKWWLKKNYSRAQVTVNGRWQCQPGHITSFINPCISEEQLLAAKKVVSRKSYNGVFRVIFVGSINEAKGVGAAIRILAQLHDLRSDIRMEFVGDGPERRKYERLVNSLGLNQIVTFHGWVKPTDLGSFYARAHCLLLPTKAEGWPKVISEGMAYGVVPVASAIGSIPQFIESFNVGRVVSFKNEEGFVNALREYVEDRTLLKAESKRALQFAHRFTYERYRLDVMSLLRISHSRS